MKRKKIYSIAIFLILWTLFILSLFPRDYSHIEMRENAKKPVLNKKNIFDGTFGKEFESYLIDGAPFKVELYTLHSNYRYLMGNRELKNVYLTSDRLYQKPLKNPKLLEILKNREIYKNMEVYLLPYKMYYGTFPLSLRLMGIDSYIDEYDSYRKYADHDLSKLLSIEDYYKSDHHLNSKGIEKIIAHFSLGDYEIKNSIPFTGGLTRKTGLKRKDDFIPVTKKDCDLSFTFGENEAKKGSEKIYQEHILNGNIVDKYLFYLGGNYGKIKIVNKFKKGRLVIIKDSFANPFIPFFANDYGETIVLDLRFLREKYDNYLKDADKIIVFSAL